MTPEHEFIAGDRTGVDISINVAVSVKAPRKQHSDARPVAVWEPVELIKFRAAADQADQADHSTDSAAPK